MWNTILFDLDGTLTDPKLGITTAVGIALEHFGIHESPDNLTRFIGPPLMEAFPEAEIVNREDDLGIPGLRKAKESYDPIGYARKFRVSQIWSEGK